MDNPTVSVIIPTYNRAHLLGRAIESILSQTYQDFELIVVDDGSTDNTEQVIKGFTDERIRYIKLEKNRGEAVARNTGIKLARGQYVAGQDDDSEWLPDKLEKQMKAFEDAPSNVGVVYTGMWCITENGRGYWTFLQKEGNIHKQFLKQNYIGHPTILIKKECFTKVGLYDEKLPSSLDWDMWIRVSKYYDFKLIDEPLVTTYLLQITTHYAAPAVMRGMIMLLEKHFQEYKKYDKRSLAGHYFSSGVALCINEDLTQFAEGRKYLWKAAQICPVNFKYIIFGLISLSGPTLFHNRSLRQLYRQFSRSTLRIV